MSKINIKRMFLSLLKKDELGIGNLIFDKPEYIYGIQQYTAKVKTNDAQQYAEGVLSDTDTTLQNIELTINLKTFTNAQRAKYLGHHLSATGGVYALADDVAPYLAILVEWENDDHSLGYQVMYKGKLSEPDTSVKQKEGKTDYQNDSATATFLPLKNNGMWQYTVETTDDNCPADISTKFFDEVIIPTEATQTPISNISLSSSTPTDGATNVTLAVNPTLTFNNKISKNDIILLNDTDGSIVAITKVFDATGKILTIEPNSALVASKKYSIVVTGVEDVYMQKLSQSLISFTTASA